MFIFVLSNWIQVKEKRVHLFLILKNACQSSLVMKYEEEKGFNSVIRMTCFLLHGSDGMHLSWYGEQSLHTGPA